MNTKAFTKADSSEILRATQVYANVSSGGLKRFGRVIGLAIHYALRWSA